jgi:hypothetical protein
MQRANGRQKQDAYRFKPRQRDVPISEDEKLSLNPKKSSVVSSGEGEGDVASPSGSSGIFEVKRYYIITFHLILCSSKTRKLFKRR